MDSLKTAFKPHLAAFALEPGGLFIFALPKNEALQSIDWILESLQTHHAEACLKQGFFQEYLTDTQYEHLFNLEINRVQVSTYRRIKILE